MVFLMKIVGELILLINQSTKEIMTMDLFRNVQPAHAYHPEGTYRTNRDDYPRESVDSINTFWNGHEHDMEKDAVLSAEIIRFYPNGQITWDGKGYNDVPLSIKDKQRSQLLTRRQAEKLFNIKTSNSVLEEIFVYDVEQTRSRLIMVEKNASSHKFLIVGITTFVKRYDRTIKLILYATKSFHVKTTQTDIRRKTVEEIISL